MQTSLRLNVAIAVAMLGISLSQPALADDLELVKLAGINGTSTVPGHTGWTDAHDISFTISSDVKLSSATASVGKASLSTVSWKQAVDKTLPAMYQNLYIGRNLTSSEIDYVHPNSSSGLPYFSIDMGSTFFTDISFANNQASVSVAPKTFKLSYDKNGISNKSNLNTDWDITRNSLNNGPLTIPAKAFDGDHAAAAPGGFKEYLRIEGVAGESTAIGYENWIEINNAALDVNAPISNVKGTGAIIGKAETGNFTWTQGIEGSFLSEAALIITGRSVKQIVLEYVTDEGAGPVTFMQTVLNDVYFNSVGLSGETVSNSVIAKSISQTVWDINDDGTRGKSTKFSWNIIRDNTGSVDDARTLSGFGGGNLSPDAPSIMAVPEPSLAWLLGGGLMLVGLRSRRT